MPYCHGCVVHCVDFRIQGTIDDLIRSLALAPGEYDRISVAGGAAYYAEVLRQAQICNRLHRPSLFVLTVHEDCGAGAKRDDLKEARRITREASPNAVIRTFYVKLDGSWEEEFSG